MRETVQPREIRTEGQVIGHYLSVLNGIYGRTDNSLDFSNVRKVIGKDANGAKSEAWRIIINPPVPGTRSVLVDMDYDDTLAPTSETKRPFHTESAELVPEHIREDFMLACRQLNRAARVIPAGGGHPERYAPLLELLAISKMVDSLNKPETAGLTLPKTEIDAREFISNTVLGLTATREARQTEGLKVSVVEEVKNGKPKKYFKEERLQEVGINFESDAPRGVNQNVWDSFNRHMAGPTIPENEFDNFDLPDSVRFGIVTFGQLDIQLEKIVNGIAELKKHKDGTKDKKIKLPDEIIVFTSGRKDMILGYHFTEEHVLKSYYGDDSPGQLESVNQMLDQEEGHEVTIF